MNIAITGSNGFIGGHLKNMLSEMGISIILISNNHKSHNRNNFFTYDDFFSGRINKKIDCMLHLASPNYEYAKDNSLQTGITALTTSIVKNLYIYDCKKIIFFSSAKVYGEPSMKNVNFKESSQLEPITEYGTEKAKAERFIISYSKSNDIDYLIYRMPMVYGSDMKSNVGNLLKLIDKSYPIAIFRNTDYLKKSYLSIENIKILIKYNIQNMDSINNCILNIADNDAYSIEEFIKTYISKSGSSSKIIRLPYFIFKSFLHIPSLKKLMMKLYGDFRINNDKINKIEGIKLMSVKECISQLVDNKN